MMKNTPKESDNFTPRQVAVLIEEFRGQFRVFGEGLDNLGHKFDKLDDRFGRFEIKFDKLDMRVDGIDIKIEGVRTNQARTLERITRIELNMNERFDMVDKRFDSVENRLDRFEASKI